ncbi:hypothetical protein [Mycoavidus sp. SF9855]|uniref:hypothetical protein n=1 Tax=Mycoavidus sp. SF9855 TaxID=2968475 RepID=UPI00211D058E|nr:hypothetical protein [Mycoavidus sp. SF9855]UUM20918.1 hypothetical protein NQD60_05400 [Mycoavidus sp. SF9855]
MNSGGSGGIPDVANHPATFAAMYKFNKPIQDNTAAILNKLEAIEIQDNTVAILNELKDIKANQQQQDAKYLTREEAKSLLERYGARSRATSITSLNSNSSNDSQATTLVGSTSSSRPNTPPNLEQAKKIEELEEIIKRQDQKISGLETTLTHVNSNLEQMQASQLTEEKLANMLGKFLNPNNLG